MQPTATLAPTAQPQSNEPPPEKVIAISAGAFHMCQLTDKGIVSCWGDNSAMQLGGGTYTDSTVPLPVEGLGTDVIAVSAGGSHTCALTSVGAVKCWGDNHKGQLGDGTKLTQTEIVTVSGLEKDVIAISAGGEHTCALLSSGALKCWGAGLHGRLGDGEGSVWEGTPVEVTGLDSQVSLIAAGTDHTCVLHADGSASCWGLNEVGQLGIGEDVHHLKQPGKVADLSGATALASGFSGSCAITGSGEAVCWGWNGFPDRLVTNHPVPVEGAVNAARIAVGSLHACMISSDNQVFCWGSNEVGQLGNGNEQYSVEAVPVGNLRGNLVAIAAGFYYTCVLNDAGEIQCWGSSIPGEGGEGSTSGKLLPKAPPS